MMKNSIQSFAVTALAATSLAKVNLIIDTDMGLDLNDVGALAIAHNLADKG